LRTGRIVLSETVTVFRPEGEIAHILGAAQAQFADVAMGSYPFFEDGRYGTNLVLRSTDATRLAEAESALRIALSAAGVL
jgi:molybdopterin-biosynthesis enzyme MoeA-like protein